MMKTTEEASSTTGQAAEWQEPTPARLDLGVSPWETPGDGPSSAATGNEDAAVQVQTSSNGDTAAEAAPVVLKPEVADPSPQPPTATAAAEVAAGSSERVSDPEPEVNAKAEAQAKPEPVAIIPDASVLFATRLAALQELVETRFKVDQHKEKIIDRLHEELQSHKDDLLAQLLKPVLTDLLRLHDDLSKILRDYREKPPEDVQTVVRSLSSFPDDILDILSRQGLEAFNAEPDSTFDPKIQSVISKAPTTDSSRDKAIAESIRPGFLWGERIFRRNMVRIHVFQNPEPAPPAGTTAS